MKQLPYIDEHVTKISAPRERVWAALIDVLSHEVGRAAPIARVLGCDPVRATPEFDGRPGQSLPGFRVVEADPGRRLALAGRHRFSRYELTFVLGAQSLRAQTHAAFPGAFGRLYGAAVIGTGGHRLATRHLLRQVARRA